MAKKILTQNLSEPLDGAMTAKFDINAGTGNLMIDRLAGGEPVLAAGELQYLEGQDLPTRSLTTSSGRAALTLKASSGQQTWLRLPWAACNGATQWQVHLNPDISADITAHSNGGNIKLDLAGMAVTRVAADTGGGNMDVILPDRSANLDVTAKTSAGVVTVEIGGGTTGSSTLYTSSGAGNVVINVPGGIAARIHATSGMGQVIVTSQFSKINANTYQSPDYESAANKIEVTAKSGAGNVIVNTK